MRPMATPRPGPCPRLVGVVHLPPLPGAPGPTPGFQGCREAALRDAQAWRDGGADALLVENLGDVPYRKERVDPHVPAFLSLLARELQDRAGLPVGINCLRNDAFAAMGAAAAAGGAFIRVNVLLGVTATDQGLVEGRAAELLRYRRALEAAVAVWADVDVKHGTPLFRPTPGEAATGLVMRGGADALVVTGPVTGSPPEAEELAAVREAAPARVPVLVGSGARPELVAEWTSHASGVIAGTCCKQDGVLGSPVDPLRVARLARACRDLEGPGEEAS